MKRIVAAAVGMCFAGAVLAQGAFNIIGPAEGSRVREKVKVRIPKNSIEEGSYIGVFLGGKFLEATVPPIEGNYRVYTLDTKARQIPDGELKLELVKYVPYQDQPRIVDRSSVTVTVGNQMNVPVPAAGVKLRYNLAPGREYVYRLEESVTTSVISGANNSLGGRPAEMPASDFKSRVLYAVDNRYGNGEALLRMQRLPDKGKSYAVLMLNGETEPRRVDENEMAATYLRISGTGRPLFGSIPAYFGFSNSGTGGSFLNVISVWPLPVLPEKAVRPGSTWSAAYLFPRIQTEGAIWDATGLTRSFPARGEFLSAEWEMGHPCAKIRNSIAQGTKSIQGEQLEKAGRAFADDKVQLEETIWFALDTRVVIKRVRTVQIDAKMSEEAAGGNGGGGAGTQTGPRTAQPGGVGAAPGAAGGPVGAGLIRQGRSVGGGRGPTGIAPGGAGGGGGQQTQGGRGTNRSGGAGGRVMYVRQRFQQTFILE